MAVKEKAKKKRKIIRKADIVLLGVFLLVAALLFARPFLTAGSSNSTSSSAEVTVRQDGKVVGTYPLGRDKEINLDTNGRHNEIVIENGSVYMKESSCKNQVCVDQGKITQTGQSIICLPNRVVVEITRGDTAGENSSREDDGVDAVAK